MFKHPGRVTYDQMKETLLAISNPKDQQIACLAYATGARVSELNHIHKDGFYQREIKGNQYLIITCPVLKKRKLKVWDETGDHIDKKTNRRYFTKAPPARERRAPVRMDEDWLIKPILALKESAAGRLITLDRSNIWRRLTSAVSLNGVPVNPHGFRKLRATHLRRNFGFDAYQLKKFFDWSTIAPSDFYVGLDEDDIAY